MCLPFETFCLIICDIYLGDGVTATVAADACYLIVGEQVTINIVWLTVCFIALFSGTPLNLFLLLSFSSFQILWDFINLGTVPTSINVLNTSLALLSNIFANSKSSQSSKTTPFPFPISHNSYLVELFGMLSIGGNVTINGTISGPGSVYVYGDVICTNMSVKEGIPVLFVFPSHSLLYYHPHNIL